MIHKHQSHPNLTISVFKRKQKNQIDCHGDNYFLPLHQYTIWAQSNFLKSDWLLRIGQIFLNFRCYMCLIFFVYFFNDRFVFEDIPLSQDLSE
jgi:hypothetical protein